MIAEIELTALNTQVAFRPLGRARKDTLRSRYDFREMNGDGALAVHRHFGVIPGQKVAVDVEKSTGTIIEPIHADKALKEKIESGWRLHPERREFKLSTPERWLRAMVRLVQAGLASLRPCSGACCRRSCAARLRSIPRRAGRC